MTVEETRLSASRKNSTSQGCSPRRVVCMGSEAGVLREPEEMALRDAASMSFRCTHWWRGGRRDAARGPPAARAALALSAWFAPAGVVVSAVILDGVPVFRQEREDLHLD